jgi:DNA-binding NarL/FixJ family response regulator
MSRYRIVLADDHMLIREGLRRLIEDYHDLEVIGEAGDGLELLSLLDEQVPDLVIMDISMPNLRGVEAAKRIKSKYPAVKVLILSMYREYQHQAMAAGADGYLLKEDAPRELFDAIASVRQGKSFLSTRLSEGRCGLPAHGEGLSVREKEVLKLIVEGKSSKEIAEELFISIRTVESHRASIIAKLRVKSVAELVRCAIQNGYI